jgi:hypothetical protein
VRPVEILTLLEEEVEHESGATGNAVHARFLLARRPQAHPMCLVHHHGMGIY